MMAPCLIKRPTLFLTTRLPPPLHQEEYPRPNNATSTCRSVQLTRYTTLDLSQLHSNRFLLNWIELWLEEQYSTVGLRHRTDRSLKKKKTRRVPRWQTNKQTNKQLEDYYTTHTHYYDLLTSLDPNQHATLLHFNSTILVTAIQVNTSQYKSIQDATKAEEIECR